MSHFKPYMLLAAFAAAICILKFYPAGSDYESVGKFRGANLDREDWNPLIADTVNEKLLTVAIDNKEYTNRDLPIFMDDNLNIMVPADILTEGLNCSSHLYEGKKLLVEKRSDAVLLGLGDPEITVNDEKHKIASPMIRKKDAYFVSIGEVSRKIGYDYEWKIEKNRGSAVDLSEAASIVPASYDLRKKGRVGTVKNQGNSGTCWAFASLSALESSLLPKEELQLSPDHMSMSNSFVVDEKAGGEYTMAMAYLLGWQGPVYEKDDPFGDGKTNRKLSAVKHVQEVQIMEGKDYGKIKEAVFKDGSLQRDGKRQCADSVL